MRFESWQPLIRFAASEEINDDPKRMSELYLYGSAAGRRDGRWRGFAFSIILGYALMTVIGLKPEHMPMVAIYALAIATNIRGVPTAALRFEGKFRTLAYVQMLSSLIRLGLAVAGLLMGWSLIGFIILWTACQMFDSLLFLWLGMRTIRKKGIPSPLSRQSARAEGQKLPGLHELCVVNQCVEHLADTDAGGRYAVGQRLCRNGLGRFLPPRQTDRQSRTTGRRYDAGGNLPRHGADVGEAGCIAPSAPPSCGCRVCWALVGLGLLAMFWLLGDWMMRVAFGPEFADAYPLLIAQLVAVVLIMHAAPSRSALLAMNRPGFVLWVAIASTILFFAPLG